MLIFQGRSTKHRIVFVVVVAVIGCLLSALLRYSNFDPPAHNRWGFGCDADTYWDLSGNLLARQAFVDSPGMGHAFSYYNNSDYVPNVLRLPGYPLVLAGARMLWDEIAVAYLLNYLIYIGICVYSLLVATLVYKRLSGKWLFLFVIMLAFSPVYLIHMQGVQSDTFAALTLIAFTYHFFRVQSISSLVIWKLTRPKLLLHAGGAIIFGALCLLTRANTLLYIFPLLLMGTILSYRRAKDSLKLNIVITLICVAALAAWGARNYSIMSRFSISVAAGNNVFLHYVYSRVQPKDELYAWKNLARREYMVERIAQGRSATEAESDLDLKLRQISLEYALASPMQSLRTAGRGMVGLFTSSYFDISDVVTAKLFGLNLVDNHYVDASTLGNSHPLAPGLFSLFRESSLFYKRLLLFSFFLLPVLFWLKRKTGSSGLLFAIWLSSALFLIGTALMVPSADRLRLPVHSLNTLFFIVFLIEILDLFRKVRAQFSH